MKNRVVCKEYGDIYYEAFRIDASNKRKIRSENKKKHYYMVDVEILLPNYMNERVVYKIYRDNKRGSEYNGKASGLLDRYFRRVTDFTKDGLTKCRMKVRHDVLVEMIDEGIENFKIFAVKEKNLRPRKPRIEGAEIDVINVDMPPRNKRDVVS